MCKNIRKPALIMLMSNVFLKLYSLEIFTKLLIKVSKLRGLLTFNDHIEICSDVLGFSFLTTVQSSWD